MPKSLELTTTPRLRFPEFQDEWRATTLADFFDLDDKAERATGFDCDKILTVRLHANGVVKNAKTGILAGGTSYFRRRAGQFIFSKIDLLNGAFGIIPDELDGFHSSSDIPALSFKPEAAPSFLLSWFKRSYESLELERTGTSSTLKRVAPNKLLNLPVLVPSPAEQLKIADCLTSLDACVATQGRKVDALKAHKRWLVQQLFPRRDENLPRLRFPEFVSRVDWVKRSMADLLDRASQPVSVDAETFYREIGVRSHGKGIFHKQPSTGEAIGDKRVFSVVPNAFVVNIVFAWEQAVAVTSEAETGMIASHRFPMYLGRAGNCDVRFLKFAFLTPEGRHLLGLASPGGAGRNRTLGQAEFEKIGMTVPANLDEQVKIADCFVVMDGLIAAEEDKLVTLKNHKRGLSQHLFPQSKSVGA